MGQQQLLLVILVIIIVAIASVTAVSTFGSATDQANRDALTNDMVTLAGSAQDYYFRPETLSGGGRAFDGFVIEGKLLPVSGISSDGLYAETENGTLEVISAVGALLSISGHPSSCDGYIPGTIDENGILSSPGTCSGEDQILASVESDVLIFE